MKKLLPIFSIAIIFAACNSTPKETLLASAAPIQQIVQPDTVGLASYQAWKIQNELKDVQEYNRPEQPVMVAPEKVKKTRQVYRTPVPKATTPAPVKTTESSTSENNAGGSASTEPASGTIGSESTETAKAEEKKGISKAAKGAVIGGVVGAGAGAVINKKNPVVGAVIGGVIGAGGGYVIGKKMDKKDGR